MTAPTRIFVPESDIISEVIGQLKSYRDQTNLVLNQSSNIVRITRPKKFFLKDFFKPHLRIIEHPEPGFVGGNIIIKLTPDLLLTSEFRELNTMTWPGGSFRPLS